MQKQKNDLIDTITETLTETVEIGDFTSEKANEFAKLTKHGKRNTSTAQRVLAISKDLTNPDFLSNSNNVAEKDMIRIAGVCMFHGLHLVAFLSCTITVAMRYFIPYHIIWYIVLVLNFLAELAIYEYLRSLNPGVLLPSYNQQQPYFNGPFVDKQTGLHRVYMKKKKLYLYPSDFDTQRLSQSENTDYVLLDSKYCEFCRSYMPIRSKHERDQIDYFNSSLFYLISKKIRKAYMQHNKRKKDHNADRAINKISNNGSKNIDGINNRLSPLGGDDKNGYCVANFDHYCAWVGTSIGEGNRFFFTIFLFTEFVLFVHYLAFTFTGLGSYRKSMEGNINFSPRNPSGVKEKYPLALVMNENMLLTIMLISFLFFIPFVGSLAAYHMFLLCSNSTTYEGLKEDSLFYIVNNKSVFSSDSNPNTIDSKKERKNDLLNDFLIKYGPYDKGTMRNFKESYQKYQHIKLVTKNCKNGSHQILSNISYNTLIVKLKKNECIYHEGLDPNDKEGDSKKDKLERVTEEKA